MISDLFRPKLTHPTNMFAWVLALVVVLSWSASVAASDARDFFDGKRLTYIVPTKPGGGYDTYARLIAKHLPKHLPVRSVVVRNVPGAGHLIGLRQLFTAEPDGLTIGTLNTGLIYAQVTGAGGMKDDLRELSWIGKASSDTRVFMVGTQVGLEGVNALMGSDRPLRLASSGKTSASNIETELILKVLGVDATLVHGFGGTEAELAVMRGDVDGMLGSYSSLRGFVEQGYGHILFRVGDGPAELSAVPELETLVADSAGRRVAELIAAQSTLGRLTAAPPGVAQERLVKLRTAYLNTLADPELLREAEIMKVPIDSMDGEEVGRRISRILADPDAIASLLAEFPATE